MLALGGGYGRDPTETLGCGLKLDSFEADSEIKNQVQMVYLTGGIGGWGQPGKLWERNGGMKQGSKGNQGNVP